MKEKKQSLRFFYWALRNARPLLELKNQQRQSKGSRRKQKPVPAPVSSKRGEKLAIQWIIEGAKKRPERTMALRLYLESLDAYNERGCSAAMKKKTELHNQCKVSFFRAAGTPPLVGPGPNDGGARSSL